MKYLFLIMFIGVTITHLYASLKQDKKLRAITKPFILMSLLGFYIFAEKNIELTIVLALITSLIGDILLIIEGNKWLIIGGLFFVFSHLFFIATYILNINFEVINFQLIISLALLFGSVGYIIFHIMKSFLPKKMFYSAIIYLTVNAIMNCFAFFRLLTLKDFGSLITSIGALLFFISDTSVFFARFYKKGIFKNHFIVMLTYALGELLIVLGFII